MDAVNVVYITDEKYAMPTCVSMLALIANKAADTELEIFIIANKVSDNKKESFVKQKFAKVNISVIDLSADVYEDFVRDCITGESHVSPVALLKFDLPNILAKLDKVIYLDGDVIVQKDLSELYKTNLGKNYVAAVDDMGDTEKDGKSRLASRIGMRGNSYFNSGVMLLNLKKMRKDNITQKLTNHRMTQKNFFMDQDSLNYVFESYRTALPYKYNFRCAILDEIDFSVLNAKFFNSKYSNEVECIREQVILHLTDKRKPWEFRTYFFSEIFEKYYKMTPYSEMPLSLQSPLLDQKRHYEKILEQLVRDRMSEKKDWHFPWERIQEGARVIIYGAGGIGKSFVQQMAVTHYCRVVLWVDKDYVRMGCAVNSPEDIVDSIFDYVIVAIKDEEITKQVVEYLVDLGIDANKIICPCISR